MLYTYQFRAQDTNSVRGNADVTLIAASEEAGRVMLTTLCGDLGRELDFDLIQSRPYNIGVVRHNVEQEPIIHDFSQRKYWHRKSNSSLRS